MLIHFEKGINPMTAGTLGEMIIRYIVQVDKERNY
jgi:hypothetical protein